MLHAYNTGVCTYMLHVHVYMYCMCVDMSSSLEGGLGDVAIEVLHCLLSHLLRSPEDEVGVAKESIDAFVQTLRRGKQHVCHNNLIHVHVHVYIFILHVYTCICVVYRPRCS